MRSLLPRGLLSFWPLPRKVQIVGWALRDEASVHALSKSDLLLVAHLIVAAVRVPAAVQLLVFGLDHTIRDTLTLHGDDFALLDMMLSSVEGRSEMVGWAGEYCACCQHDNDCVVDDLHSC
jgi:hypothetical protein